MMLIEKIILSEERNVSLTAYIQEVGGEFSYIDKRPAILILPGGGYQFCSDREAEPVALAYLKAGFQAFVLRYSVGVHAAWPQPLNDYEQAMAMIRANSERWLLDPERVAVIGFSAGGHLAGCAAAMAENKPNAVILGYAVVYGEDAVKCNPTAPDVVAAVDRNTAPSFIFASRRDNVVPIRNSTLYANACAVNDVAFESHIYAYGPHGFSLADSSLQDPASDMCVRISDWVEDSIAWLKETMGDYTAEGLSDPAYRLHMTDDGENYYSADCSLLYLFSQEEAKEIVTPVLDMIGQAFAGGAKISIEDLSAVLGDLTLRDMLGQMHIPASRIKELDEKLRGLKKEV